MNRYACYFTDNKGCIVLNAKDDEEAAWLGKAHARLNGAVISDIMPLDTHHFTPETPDLYGE
mgnify:FL=1